MTNAIEAVARAIDPAAFESWSPPPRGLEGCNQETIAAEQNRRQNRAREKARAAIEAMFKCLEEPSDAAINCGGVAVYDSSPADFHEMSREACRSLALPAHKAMLAQQRKDMLE